MCKIAPFKKKRNSVSPQSPSSMNITISNGKNSTKLDACISWFAGGLISFIPLIFIDGFIALQEGLSLSQFWSLFIRNEEIFFICVTLLATSLMMLRKSTKKTDILSWGILLSIISISLLYTLIAYTVYTDGNISWDLSTASIISMIMTVVLGIASFIRM